MLTKRRLLVVLTVAVFLSAWNRAFAPLYIMFTLLLATVIVSHWLPRLALRGVQASRTHSPYAFEGQELLMSSRLRNQALTARRMLELVDSVPVAVPGQRNPMLFIARLAGGTERDYTLRLECYKRGFYQLGPLKLRSGYPLGLAYHERQLPQTATTLLVYPQTFPITRFPFPGGGGTPLRGAEAISLGGGQEEFFGTREYRPGDSPRYVHWSSTARHGELIVKEFELRAATELTIVLDLDARTNVGEDREHTLEYAVKIAASVTQFALERGHQAQLAGYAADDWFVPSGAGRGQQARMLDVLARVVADGNTPYPQAIRQAAATMREGATALLIFTDPGADSAGVINALALLRARHVQPVCVFLNRSSFKPGAEISDISRNPLVQRVQAEGMPVYVVSRGDDLSRIFA